MVKIYAILLFCLLTCASFAQRVDNLPYADGNHTQVGWSDIQQKGSEPFAGKITLHPNPAIDFFRIDTEEKIGRVYVINVLGTIVKQFDASRMDRFDIHGLTPGVYFIKMDHAESNRSRTLRLRIQ